MWQNDVHAHRTVPAANAQSRSYADNNPTMLRGTRLNNPWGRLPPLMPGNELRIRSNWMALVATTAKLDVLPIRTAFAAV